jgi:hypothetical protein
MVRSLLLFVLLVVGCLSRAEEEVNPLIRSIEPGEKLTGLSNKEGSPRYFAIWIPEGTLSAVVVTGGGRGNCDLSAWMESAGGSPQVSQGPTNAERIEFKVPAAGRLMVRLTPYSTYSGMHLTVILQTTPRPTFRTVAGSYVGSLNVGIVTPSWARLKGVIRYTTDGTEPNADSPIYVRPLKVLSTTRVMANSYYDDFGYVSPTVERLYTILQNAGPEPMQLGRSVDNLAGGANSSRLFVVDAPRAGTYRVSGEGRAAGSSILIARNRIPQTRSYDLKPRWFRSPNGSDQVIARAVVRMNAPGKIYIRLQGSSTFSEASLLAQQVSDGPDLSVFAPSIEPYIFRRTFTPETDPEDDCAVKHGWAQAGSRRLLVFTLETRNTGGADFRGPSNEEDPEFYEFDPCHRHYHLKDFMRFELVNQSTGAVTAGRKEAWNLANVSRFDLWAPENPEGGPQTISAGWADIYGSSTPGQWIDVTDIVPGDYLLRIMVNPSRRYQEADYENNTTVIRVTIPTDNGENFQQVDFSLNP